MERRKENEEQRGRVLFTATLTSFFLSLAMNSEGIFLTGKSFFVYLLVLTLVLGGFILWVLRKQAKQSELDEFTEKRLEKSLQRLQALLRDDR